MKNYPLLQTQVGIFVECMKYPESTQYNLPSITMLTDDVDIERLERALCNIYIKRRELRLSFIIDKNGNPRQQVSEAKEFFVRKCKMREAEVEEYAQTLFVRPFDLLGDEPLFRAEIVETEGGRYLLMDYHHIIMDGTSSEYFFLRRDMSAAYLGEELEESDYGMPEYAEEEKLFGPAFDRDRSYYIEKFSDITLSSMSAGKSDSLGRLLRESVFIPLKEVEEWCLEHKVSTDVLFQAAFGHVLSVFTQEKKIAYTMMGHGRYDKRIQETYGMYVETLPVCVEKEAGMSVMDFLRANAREKMLALRHHAYPFTCFCQELEKRPGIGFNFLAMEDAEEKLYLGDIVLPLRQIDPLKVCLDLTVSVYRVDHNLQISVSSGEYRNDQSLLKAFAEAMKDTIGNMMRKPLALIEDIPVVSKEKEKALVKLSSGEHMDYVKEKTWIHMFLENVKKAPEHIAVVDTNGSITYRELDEQSDAVAAYLRAKGVAANEFVAVKMSRIKEFVVAVIGIQKAGAAYVPVDEDYPEERIQYMMEDSGARVIFDEVTIRQILRSHCGAEHINLASVDNYAYMIYTSGSTGRPKGVIQSHRSLCHFVSWRTDKLGITPKGIYGHFNSFSFDGSLDDLVCPLAAGATVHIFDEQLRRSLVDISDYITEHKLTGMTTSTQFGMELIRYNPKLGLDYLMMGGEKLLPTKETAFRVINGYGPTEFTVCSSYYVVQGDEETLPIGRPVPNTLSLICDIHGNLLPQGITGELCLAGPQIAQGYWNQPELTEKVFCEYVINGEKIKVYRTGDLARYNKDGQLEYVGRRDQQVKLRGYRIEFGEIENQAVCHPLVEHVAAEVKFDKLVLYYTRTEQGMSVEPRQIEEQVGALIEKTLAHYMVPSAYVMLDEFPMTPGGKIDRKALPDPELTDVLMEEAADETERELFMLAAEIIGTDHFGVTDNLIGLGMSSIVMMRYAALIQEKLSAKVAVSEMMKEPTVRGIAMHLSRTELAGRLRIRNYDIRENNPLTENQKGVYLDWEMNQDTTQYNVPSAYILGEIDEERFIDAIERVMDAHSYLKTRLGYEAGELVQKRNYDKVSITRTVLENEPDEAYFQRKVRPFNLLEECLCRVELVSHEKNYWLFIDIHHIIYDGISNNILIKDILSYYKDKSLTEEKITAYDFALFEQEYKESQAFKNAGDYFDRLVCDKAATSYPDSVKPDGCEYGMVTAEVSANMIDSFCKEHDVTAGSFLQAVFAETLRRITWEQDILYATVSSGRMEDVNLLNSMGMYVRTLPVVISGDDLKDSTSVEYIKKVSAQMNDTVRHELYPYTKLVEDYGIRADILFTFQGGIYEGGEVEGVSQIPLKNDTVKFDLCVTVYPLDDHYVIMVEYNGKRYGRKDMQTLAAAIGNVAINLTKEEELNDVGLLSETQVQEVIKLSEGEKLEFDTTKTFLDLFEGIVKDLPDHPAVVDIFSSYTYKELDMASDAIATYLLRQGVKKNDFVVIKMDRVKEFAAATLGVYKAGACYVPIDPAYPEERIKYMEENSETKFILNEAFIEKILKEVTNPEHVNKATPDGNAYMIYTSGSTGKPKGSILHHKGLMNVVMGIKATFGLVPEDRISAHRSFSFDAHVADFYPVLSSGATLYLIPEEIRKEPDQIYEFLLKNKITGGSYATAMLRIMHGNYELKQRYISGGGEALLDTVSEDVQVYNEYGPTECTVDSSIFTLEKGKNYETIPIGRAMVNGWLFIVDKAGKLLPPGVRGEICYAGPQVGNGYWKLPERTAEVFCDCPFVPGERMYRTGDLGYYDEDGNIIFSGRIDFQIKLNGYRIELEEIENCALGYEGIDHVAAVVKKEKLILYYTVQKDIDVEELKAFMSKTLAEYMVPSIFMQMETMPMTPNGKIDRKALPKPVIKSTQEYIEPVTREEIAVAESMQKILGLQQKVGLLGNFFELGGDSIKAIRMTSLLRQSNVVVRVSDILKLKVVKEIAKVAQTDTAIEMKSQTPFEGEVSDSAIFKYFRSLELPKRAHYNQATCLKMSEKGDITKLQRAMNAITGQHDLLRASVREDKLFVGPSKNQITISEYKVSSLDEISQICQRLQTEIKMEEALVKCAYFELEGESYLFIVAHHLVIDGVSWRIIISDLETAYKDICNGKEAVLPAKTSTYSDYTKALKKYRDSYELSLEIPYWKAVQKKLLSLPASKEGTGRLMGKLKKVLSPEESQAFLKADYAALSADANDLLLTAVLRSYALITGEDSISVQLEGHGRENFDEDLLLDRTVGWFTSIYPVVVEELTGERKMDFIKVKETLHRIPKKGAGYNILRYLEGEEQDSFVSQLIPKIGFNYLGEMTSEQMSDSKFMVADDIEIGESVSPENICGPDIGINCELTNGSFYLTLDYNKEVMKEEQAESFVSHIFEEIGELSALLADMDEKTVTATDLGETEWTPEEFGAVYSEFVERGEKITRIYPMLPMQEGMLYAHESNPDAWQYRLVNIYELDVLPKEEQLLAALKRLGEKHEVLRSAIIYDGVKQARQAIIDRKLPVFMEDFSDREDKEGAVYALREKILSENYDLQKKPLFQLYCVKKSDDSCYLLTATHHIIVDGWCFDLYQKDLFGFIAEEMEGVTQDETNEAAKGKYEDAVREILNKDKRAGLEYWRTLLSGYETKTGIPSYGTVSPEEQCDTEELFLFMDEDITAQYEELCKEEQATLNNGAELAWGLVLQTYNRTEDAVFAKVVSGRDNPSATDVSDVVGLFINSVPVRVKVDKTETARQMLKKLQKQAVQSNEWDFCSLSEVQQVSDLGMELISSVFVFENYNSGLESEETPKDQPFHIKTLMLKEERFNELEPCVFVADGRLGLRVTFNKEHYRKREIEQILELFRVFITGMVKNPDKPISSLPRLSEEQKAEIIKLSEGEKLSIPENQTWLDKFEEHVRMQPNHMAVEDNNGSYTYEQLACASDKVAAYLSEQGVKPNDFVVIKMHRFKEFAVSVIGIQKIGACYVPIDPNYPEKRIEYMEKDSQAKVVIDEALVAEILNGTNTPKRMNHAKPENLAYMIYTSGSTGEPKGTMLSHRALLNYTEVYIRRFEITPDDRISHHITFSFDSHIRDFYPALAAGASLHFMSDDIVREPDEIVAFLEEKQITGSAFATAMGQLLLGNYNLKQRFISIGGESLHGVYSENVRVFNVCGATECTDVVVDYELEKGRYYDSAPIGKALPNCYAFIVDANNQLVPQGVAGEICYAGPHVGEGYWNRPEETKKVFVDCPFISGERMYHTGDLGRYNENGEIEYLGRIDFQVKLRGFRVELGEVESRAVQYEGIGQAVAAVKKDNLILYYTSGEEIDVVQLEAFMAQTLNGYMVPTVFIKLDALPMTPSGKIDRKKLPDLEVSEEVVMPQTETEKKIYDIVVRFLSEEGLGVTNGLISMGMTSLLAMRLNATLSKELCIKLRVADIMKHDTIRKLAALVEEKQRVDVSGEELHHYEEREYYPITENQRGLYIDWEMNRETTQYNTPNVYIFNGIDKDKLAEAVKKAVDAHSYLKTRLILVKQETSLADGTVTTFEQVMQKQFSDEPVEVDTVSLEQEPDAEYFQKLVTPFDLLGERLYRFTIAVSGDKTFLFMDIHHIIFDGLSNGRLLQDVIAAYKGEELEKEEITALDYAVYEQKLLQDESFNEITKYFEELVWESECVNYPDSVENTENKDGNTSVTIKLSVPSNKIDEFCKKQNVTEGSFWQAAFAETLYRMVREDKPLYVTVSNGRSASIGLENSMGMFVKTLPVVFAGKKQEHAKERTADYVKAMHEQLQNTFDREIFPYTYLVEKYKLHAEMMFAYQGGLYDDGSVETMELKLDTVKLPILTMVYPEGGNYTISLEYNSCRYSQKDMQLLATAFANIAASMAEKEFIGQVDSVSYEEKKELAELGRGKYMYVDPEETIVSMFRDRAKKTPDATAVVFKDKHLSYGEIESLTDRLACYLKNTYELESGDVVGVLINRSELMLIYPLAIMKTGAIYMPLDPSFPTERLRFMCEDASVKIVLYSDKLVEEKLLSFGKASISTDILNELPDVSREEVQALTEPKPGDLLTLLYTSGSTGVPKGVELEHKGIVNYCHWYVEEIGMTKEDRVVGFANFGFDAHMIDLYPTVLAGGSVYILDEELRMDILGMNAYMEKNNITVAFLTTQIGCLIKDINHSLRFLSIGGEKLHPLDAPEYRFANVYGPTECSLFSTYYIINGSFEGKRIGRPLANYQLYVVDKNARMVPQGIPGELLIAGVGLARGYLNRKELSEEKFIEFYVDDKEAPVRAYRSGDLVRWDEEGQIEYISRIDNQIKLRGYRIELGEIESTISKFEGINQVAVEIVGESNKQLCCYYVADKEIMEEELRTYLSDKLTDYMIPEVFMRIERMPMTPNGKSDRRALRAIQIKTSVNYVEPETALEIKVAQSMRKILGITEKISVLDSFYALGGDSIKAIRLVSLLREEDIHISVKDIMNQKTVRKIAALAEEHKNSLMISQEPEEGEVLDTAIVSFFKDLKLPAQEHFIQSMFLSVRDRVDYEKLQKALDAVTGQHDMLRAVLKDDKLFVRGADTEISIEQYDIANGEELVERCRDIRENICMEEALLRVALLHTEDVDYIYLVAHHLIIDGVSWRVLTADLEGAYETALKEKDIVLPAKTNSYSAYAKAIRQYRDSYVLENEITYWDKVQKRLQQIGTCQMKDYDRSFVTYVATMDNDATATFIHADREKLQLEINDILITALARAYCHVMDRNELSLQLEGHGRETFDNNLVIDRTIGWFTSIYPVVLENIQKCEGTSEKEGLKSDLINVKENLHRIPNKGAGYIILRYLEGIRETDYSKDIAPQLSFNYLGEMDAEQNDGGLFRVENGKEQNGSETREYSYGPDLDLNCVLVDGHFTMMMSYNEYAYEEDIIKKLADKMFEELGKLSGYLDSCEEPVITASDLGENVWSEEQFESIQKEFAKQGETIKRIYPLLPMQEGMLYKHIAESESWAYRLVSIFEMNMLPKEEELRRQLDLLGEKYEVLRTSFVYEDVPVARQVITDRKLPYEIIDISEEEDTYAAICKIREDILTNGYDLTHKALFKVVCAIKDENSCYILIVTHHMIVDGWSQQNYLADLFGGLMGHDIIIGESLDGYYENYVRRITQRDKRESLRYFEELLKGYSTRAQIPSYGIVPEDKRSAEDELKLIIPKDITDSFVRLCVDEKATVSNGVELVWGLVLQTYSHTKDAVFAKIVSGRDKSEQDMGRVTGLFINSVPVRVSIDQEVTARQMLVRLQQQATATNEHDYCPLAEIQQVSELGSELLQTVIAFQNYGSGAESTGETSERNVKIEPVMLREENFAELNITTAMTDMQELSLNIVFDNTLYTTEEIKRVMELFRLFVTEIAKEPDRTLSSLARLSEEDMDKVRLLSIGEKKEFSNNQTFVDIFLKNAKESPKQIAVADAYGSITYRELDRDSDAVAAYLLSEGVKPDQFVAIKIGRDKGFIIAVLGVMKAGAAYVPIDTEYPEDRIRYMIDDSEAEVVLTKDIIRMVTLASSEAEQINLARPEGNAYMIYTSGSTGRPKGVIQSHSSLYNFVNWRVEELELKKGGHYGQFNSFSFDGSLDDMICPLAAGGVVYILDEETRRDLFEIRAYIQKNKINGLTMSTQMGMELIRLDSELDMDYLMMGGEKLLPCPKTKYTVINGYGPTEFTVCSSYYVVQGDEEDIPIGRAVPNTASYICDCFGNPVAQGIVGEIYLVGAQMAKGYWKQPELTNERFTMITVGDENVKAYRTGDLARYNEDGQLIYVGRTDTQVKLRGYRVEFGEIENRALKFEGIEQAAANVCKDQLVLYYTVSEKSTDSGFEDRLHDFIAETVTDFMVPTIYVQIEEMPLTPNGKIDRKELPEPEILTTEAYVEPENEYERQIAESMQEVLELRGKVGALDRFYALGGDSIKVIRLISILHSKGIQLKVSDFKELQTVRKIAEAAALRIVSNEISQEAIEGELEDSAIICFFKDLNLPAGEHFTQEILLGMKERAGTEQIQKTVNALTEQHDLLRAIWKDGHLFVRSVDTVIAVEEYDLRDKEQEAAVICDKLRLDIRMNEALFRVALIHTKEKDMLFMVAHHTIMDGVSWRILVSDLELAYGQIMTGQKPKLPEKTSTYRDYVEASKEYRNAASQKSELTYWNKVQHKLMSYAVSEAKDYSRQFGKAVTYMEADMTQKLLGADRSRINLEINDLLIAAVARAYCRLEQTDNVSIQMEGHGREDIKDGLVLDRTIGWFTSIYPVVLENVTSTASDDIGRDLIMVKENLHRIPDKGVGYNIFRFIEGEEKTEYSSDKIATISFNYLGELGGKALADTMFTAATLTGDEASETKPDENAFGSDLNINCMVEDGKFMLSLTYDERKFDEEQAGAFAECIKNELVKISEYLNGLKENVVTAVDYHEDEWTEEEFEKVYHYFVEQGLKIEKIQALTEVQKEVSDKLTSESEALDYEYVGVFEIDATPSQVQLDRVLERMTEKYDVLRTAFVIRADEKSRQLLTDKKLKAELAEAPKDCQVLDYAMQLRNQLLNKKVDLMKDPLLRLICVPKDADSSYIITAVHVMASSCIGLSPELVSAKCLAYLAGEQNHNLKIKDQIAKGLVKAFYRNGIRICGIDYDYDPQKPTFIFPCGIILHKSISHLIEAWSDTYNVVVYDTINLHFYELFGGETYDDIVDFYMTLLEFMIPQSDKIFGCIGYSFGGEIAYSMATRVEKMRGCKPIIFLGDSDMIPSLGAESEKETTAADLDSFLVKQLKEHEIPQESMIFAYNMLGYLNARKKTIDMYDGKTVLLLALQNTTEQVIITRKMLASKVAMNLEIIEFPDRDHFSLHTDPKMAQVFNEMLDSYVKGKQN